MRPGHGLIATALLVEAMGSSDSPAAVTQTVAGLARLVIVAGDAQPAEAGSSVAQPLAVKLLDRFDAPVPRRIVLYRGDDARVDSALTDAAGLASMRWVLPRLPVAGNHAFTALMAGRRHACGLTTSGEVYCWGQGTLGQTGSDGPPGVQHLPTIVTSTERFTALEGEITLVGPCSVVPARVATPPNLISLVSGETGSCAVTAASRLVCWGNGLPAPVVIDGVPVDGTLAFGMGALLRARCVRRAALFWFPSRSCRVGGERVAVLREPNGIGIAPVWRIAWHATGHLLLGQQRLRSARRRHDEAPAGSGAGHGAAGPLTTRGAIR